MLNSITKLVYATKFILTYDNLQLDETSIK